MEGSSWLCAVATAKFDLDVGQAIENVYPPSSLPASALRSIAYTALPESGKSRAETPVLVADSTFFFVVPPAAHSPSKEPMLSGRLYCYVLARQWCDDSLARGAQQRSAVLVSRHPYTGHLLPLAAVVGPSLLQDFAATAPLLLAQAAAQWHAPQPSRLLQLPLGPQSICAMVPAAECVPSSGAIRSASSRRSELSRAHQQGPDASKDACSSPYDVPGSTLASDAPPPAEAANRRMHGVFGDASIAHIFGGQLRALWPLWEIMVLGKPLMVHAAAPQDCSAAVAALIALVTPLPYAQDFRPVLSVHEDCVQALVVRALQACPRCL